MENLLLGRARTLTATAAAWRFPGEASGPRPMRITEEQIRAAAEATLERWPAASAVLLFGSRARGDHLPSSDWDLAVVTDDPLNLPRDLPLLDLAELHHPEMDYEMYHDQISNSLFYFAEALRSVSHSLSGSTTVGRWAANTFANRSADAAEHLAKAMLVRNGHQPRLIHDLARLADDIAAESPGLAEAIRSLNGGTQADHTRFYADAPSADAEDVRHAVRHLKNTGHLLAAELPQWRSASMNFEMKEIRSAAVDLRDAQAVPLDDTKSAPGQATMALRNGRADALRGAHVLWMAWREPQPEPAAQPAPAARDDDLSPSPF